MQISLNPALFTTEQELKIGLIHYSKIVLASSPQMIKGRMQLYQENLFFEMQDAPLTERAGIAEWRQLWEAFGADPNEQPHAAESLLRRIAQQSYLSPIQSGVDLTNFFSLQYEIPVGLHDVAHVDGDISITLGTEQTMYEGVDGQNVTLTNILHSADNKGPFGSPYMDSIRTAVSEKTTDALHIFYIRPSLSIDKAQQLLAAAGHMFTQVNGGDYQTALLTKDTPTITL